MELISFSGYVFYFLLFVWFWDLTCNFWAVLGENSCKQLIRLGFLLAGNGGRRGGLDCATRGEAASRFAQDDGLVFDEPLF